jgi:2-hydroxycyclohexanecarboxyl-CoA dehydrogenase
VRTDLAGRVAVVLGGTKGIGRSIALSLGVSGASVVVQGRDEQAAAEVVAAIAEAGSAAVFAPADLYDYAEVDRVMELAVRTYGRLDIAVASGATAEPRARLFHEVRPEEIPLYFASRTYHRIYAVHAAQKRMREAGYGKIVMITTDAGRTPSPAESLIGAAAASLTFLTRALGKEFARSGIRINTICTTLTTGTPPYDRYAAQRDDGSSATIVKAFRKIEESIPFGLNSPQDVANLALYLASPESDRLTGAVISVNGGLSFPG